jgi:hypothetical protein
MTPEENKRLYYIRGILRNRLEERGAAYWDEEKHSVTCAMQSREVPA